MVCPASRARQPSWAVPGGWLGRVRQDPSPCSGPSRPGGIPYIGAVEKQPSSWGHRQIPFAEHLACAGLGPRRLKLSPCPLDGSTGAGLPGTEISRTLCLGYPCGGRVAACRSGMNCSCLHWLGNKESRKRGPGSSFLLSLFRSSSTGGSRWVQPFRLAALHPLPLVRGPFPDSGNPGVGERFEVQVLYRRREGGWTPTLCPFTTDPPLGKCHCHCPCAHF